MGMSLLFVALFVLGLIISFTISSRSTWDKLKDKPELQFSVIAILPGWSLYFMIAFISGSAMLWLTGSISLYWGIPSVFMTLEKNSLKTCSVFIVFYNVVILYDPVDTGRKLNVHKTFSLRPVSMGEWFSH